MTTRSGRLFCMVSAGLAAASGLWLFVTAGQAGAATNPSSVQSAWWNVAVPGAVAVPSPTTANELQVGEGAQGPLSFAAVRFEAPGGVDPGSATVVLRLDVAQTGNVGTAEVAACVTTTPWAPGGDQPSSSAPSYECGAGRESVGTVSGSSESWSLGPAFLAPGSQGTYDIALVPDPGSSTPFSADYSQPTPSSVEFTGVAPSPSGPPPTSPPATGLTSPPAAVPTFPVAPVPANVPGVVAPPAPLPSLAAGPPPSTTAVAAPGGMPAGGRAVTASAAPARDGNHAARVMAAAVLVALAGALYLLGRQPGRVPRLIGAFAGAGAGGRPSPAVQVRGIGRFARPRTGPPPRVS